MRIVLALLTAATAIAASRPVSIHSGGGWVAFDWGSSCEAMTRSIPTGAKGKAQATAGFAFTPDRRRWGEFHARLSRVPRAGSSVMAEIDGQPFLLKVQGGTAWSRSALQEQALITAARSSRTLRIDARDASGRRFVDRYRLDGAATAIDAAAARCALRGAGKIR